MDNPLLFYRLASLPLEAKVYSALQPPCEVPTGFFQDCFFFPFTRSRNLKTQSDIHASNGKPAA